MLVLARETPEAFRTVPQPQTEGLVLQQLTIGFTSSPVGHLMIRKVKANCV